jgi:hypothetical protein
MSGPFRPWHRLRQAVCTLALTTVAGCGDSSGALPVSGQVTVDGEPLHAGGGTVTFVPDKDRGNTATAQPSGPLDADGNYTLYYAVGKPGAPPGWYRVQVVASKLGPGTKTARPPQFGFQPPPPLIDPKYVSAATSGLEVEVVRNPAAGAYDLHLTK